MVKGKNLLIYSSYIISCWIQLSSEYQIANTGGSHRKPYLRRRPSRILTYTVDKQLPSFRLSSSEPSFYLRSVSSYFFH